MKKSVKIFIDNQLIMNDQVHYFTVIAPPF